MWIKWFSALWASKDSHLWVRYSTGALLLIWQNNLCDKAWCLLPSFEISQTFSLATILMNDILPSVQRASWIRRISMDYSKKLKCSMILLCTECMKWDYFHNAINRPGDLDSVQSIFPTQIHIKFKQALQHNISACGAHEYAPMYNLLCYRLTGFC